MKMFLNVLKAVALVAITLAAGTYILRGVDDGGTQDRGKSDTTVPTAPAVITPNTAAPAPRPSVTTQPISIKSDNPLQPAYRPVNQPAYIQFLRQEGKTYHSRVVGKVTGQASKKDWGIRGLAYFDYLYAVESSGKIVKNDGVTIIEERFFSKVHENLFTSGYALRIEMPEKLQDVISLLGAVDPSAGHSAGAMTRLLDNVQVPVTREWIEAARKAGLFRDLEKFDPQRLEEEIKMFTQGSDNKLLEGKTVRIIFKDGFGVSDIIPIGCGLTDRERDVIIRTNFVMDHYLFPDRQVAPDADWTIDGSVFAGFVDPRLNGKVEGQVTVTRTPDFVDADGKVSKRLKITKGQVIIRNENGPTNITGQITNLKGVCVLPDDFGVVTSAHLGGFVEYKNVSRDHLLFQAETTMQPKIDISYECSVE